MKLIAKDGKLFYGVTGGLREATIDNIDVDLESQRRATQKIEDLHREFQNECVRLDKIRTFLFTKKYAPEKDLDYIEGGKDERN